MSETIHAFGPNGERSRGAQIALGTLEEQIAEKANIIHHHDARYIRAVNGVGPDINGNVVVTGGGSGTEGVVLVDNFDGSVSINLLEDSDWTMVDNFDGSITIGP